MRTNGCNLPARAGALTGYMAKFLIQSINNLLGFDEQRMEIFNEDANGNKISGEEYVLTTLDPPPQGAYITLTMTVSSKKG